MSYRPAQQRLLQVAGCCRLRFSKATATVSATELGQVFKRIETDVASSGDASVLLTWRIIPQS